MTPASIMPPDSGGAGISSVPADARLDDLMRLPPGRKRQDEITRIVAGLAEALAPLHAEGRVHGGIHPAAVAFGNAKDGGGLDGVALDGAALDGVATDGVGGDGVTLNSVGLDASGQAMLAMPPVQPAPDAEDAPRHAGYAAFEQYTDDPAYPCGQWTDVYGLAALAYFLATGSTPPSALARRVRDDCLPLEEWGANDYDKAFCDAVNSGLAMPAHARPQTMAAFAAAMGALPLREPAVLPVVPPTIALPVDEEPLLAEAEPVAQTPPEYPPRRRPRAMPWILACLLLLAAVGVVWMQMTPAPVQLAATPQAPEQTSQAPAQTPQASAQTPQASAPAAAPAPAPILEPQPPEAAPAAQAPPAVEPEPEPTPTPAPPETAPEPKAAPKAAPVAVRVAVRPWGEVLINGRSRGVSPPLRELSLSPGRYQVTVRNASAGEHRMTLTVAAGKPASISHEFK
ncbi:hypothetical protein [Achromobacter spanius]|uniref:Protein kinase domain-containing protein n=1 Tax=Achromobacter spanius TaxID=217203 RepID=A0AA42IYB3_9BURK|nr:hypothetical protein [Achromobacter spanius]MDH0734216.1 hypothetical protein [Achromobacter spanius]